MQTLTLDLKKNPELADLLVGKQPGDHITLHTSIKDQDEQQVVLRLNEAEESEGRDENEEETPPSQEVLEGDNGGGTGL